MALPTGEIIAIVFVVLVLLVIGGIVCYKWCCNCAMYTKEASQADPAPQPFMHQILRNSIRRSFREFSQRWDRWRNPTTSENTPAPVDQSHPPQAAISTIEQRWENERSELHPCFKGKKASNREAEAHSNAAFQGDPQHQANSSGPAVLAVENEQQKKQTSNASGGEIGNNLPVGASGDSAKKELHHVTSLDSTSTGESTVPPMEVPPDMVDSFVGQGQVTGVHMGDVNAEFDTQASNVPVQNPTAAISETPSEHSAQRRSDWVTFSNGNDDDAKCAVGDMGGYI